MLSIALLLVGVRGFGCWTLASAGISKIRSDRISRQLLGGLEGATAIGLVWPSLAPWALLAARSALCWIYHSHISCSKSVRARRLRVRHVIAPP